MISVCVIKSQPYNEAKPIFVPLYSNLGVPWKAKKKKITDLWNTPALPNVGALKGMHSCDSN